MPEENKDLQEQQSSGFNGVDEEYQFTEDYIRDTLGLDDVVAITPTESSEGEGDSGSVDTATEKVETVEATPDEDYSKDEDGVDLDPAEKLPAEPTLAEGKSETSEVEDAVVARAELQNPEIRAMIEQQKQLRKLLAEREAELQEYRRQKAEAPLADEEFVNADELDEVLTNPSAFNAVLNKVYKKGVLVGKEQTLQSFDQVMDRRVRVHIDRRARAEQFFQTNPELSTPKIREYVYLVGQELAEAHPEWNVDMFYAHLGPEVKARLGIASVKQEGSKLVNKPRALSGMNKASGTRVPSKRGMRDLADEVAENLGL